MARTTRTPLIATLAASLLIASPAALAAPSLALKKVDSQPRGGRTALSAKEIEALRKAVAKQPKDRGARLALVMGLLSNGKLKSALKEARGWREHDAYNLVVVRLLGDIYRELGRHDEARRAYSAVVELLPEDAQAQRALAMVLKQSGQLMPAYQRLQAALRIRPEDMRIAFELADVAQRLGRHREATERFRVIVAEMSTPQKLRYPAKQRLAQLYAAARLRALKKRRRAESERLGQAISDLEVKGGAVNDIKVYLTWDTDRTDVDLWVINPIGEKIHYGKKRGKKGGALYDDVTDGYGPESFTAPRGAPGTYVIKVNYYSARRGAFKEARGEVVVILHEGTSSEVRHTLPYRLFRAKQTVTVARITVRR